MKPDRRKIWKYKNCKIFPIDCQPITGKAAEPIRFRLAYRNRYWRIDFPGDGWIHVETKQAAREYIEGYLARQNLPRLKSLSPEEAAKYRTIRDQVAKELPDLIARHHDRIENINP